MSNQRNIMSFRDEERWPTWAPNEGGEKRRYARKVCHGLGLEAQHGYGSRQATGDPQGTQHMNQIRNLYTGTDQTPASVGNPALEDASPWDGLPISVTGLTGQPLIDALWTSPNGWLAGSYQLYTEQVPFTTLLEEYEYYNYRFVNHCAFLVSECALKTHPKFMWDLANTALTDGIIETDVELSGYPTSGEISTLNILNDPGYDWVDQYLYLLPKWVIVDVPDLANNNWFLHIQNVLQDLILRDDGTFHEIMTAAMVGFWIYLTPTLGCKLAITYTQLSHT